MIVDSFTSRLYIRMKDNVLMYNDGKSSFELPRDLPLILDEIRNLKIEVKALREVAEAARPLIRGLELVQELGEPTEKGWRKEFKLQQALYRAN